MLLPDLIVYAGLAIDYIDNFALDWMFEIHRYQCWLVFSTGYSLFNLSMMRAAIVLKFPRWRCGWMCAPDASESSAVVQCDDYRFHVCSISRAKETWMTVVEVMFVLRSPAKQQTPVMNTWFAYKVLPPLMLSETFSYYALSSAYSLVNTVNNIDRTCFDHLF